MNVILTCLLLYLYCKSYTVEVAVYFDYLTAGHKFSVDYHMNVEINPDYASVLTPHLICYFWVWKLCFQLEACHDPSQKLCLS